MRQLALPSPVLRSCGGGGVSLASPALSAGTSDLGKGDRL